jgi:hypothetical protein
MSLAKCGSRRLIINGVLHDPGHGSIAMADRTGATDAVGSSPCGKESRVIIVEGSNRSPCSIPPTKLDLLLLPNNGIRLYRQGIPGLNCDIDVDIAACATKAQGVQREPGKRSSIAGKLVHIQTSANCRITLFCNPSEKRHGWLRDQ